MVLSFKSIAGRAKAPGAPPTRPAPGAPPARAVSSTPPARPPSGLASMRPVAKAKATLSSGRFAHSGDAGEDWEQADAGPIMAPRAKCAAGAAFRAPPAGPAGTLERAPQRPMTPGAKALTARPVSPPRPAKGSAAKGRGKDESSSLAARPKSPPARRQAPAASFAVAEAEEPVLENDDWEREFNRKWALAMGDAAADADANDDDYAGGGAEAAPDESAADEAAEDQFPPDAAEEGLLGEPQDQDAWDEAPAAPPAMPPAKRPRTGMAAPTPAAAVAGGMARRAKAPGPVFRPAVSPAPAAAAAAAPSAGQTRKRPLPGADAPITPGAMAAEGAEALCDEHPDWAARCTIDAARPGQPQRLTISMGEVAFGDAEAAEWCEWMDRRLAAERQLAPGSGQRIRFKASTVDFSENKLGLAGIKALCGLLEKHGVKTEILRLTGNLIGNEGIRCISKYLMSSSQPLAIEIHLSRNKFSPEGVKWLLGCLTMHPAYPIWMPETQRYLPLWLKVENAKLKGATAFKAISAFCSALNCSVCLGEQMGACKCGPRQCVNTGCSDEVKHNCIAHLCSLEVPEDAVRPVPAAHARAFFAAPGRGALRVPPSGCGEPLRDEPRILYEDDDVAVILKPAGWSCQPNPKGVNAAWARQKPLQRRHQVGQLMAQPSPPPLQAWLLLHYGADPNCEASRDQEIDRGIVHRLDVDTSGPLLVGKTMQGFEHARKQISLGILKDYVALVHGTFSTERGECHAPIDASPFAETKRVRVDATAGSPATTVWEALAEYESPEDGETYTLVHCRMVTLRTHQIRIHMQHLGHPVVGDKLYGPASVPDFCPRMFVHKVRIGFLSLQGRACIESCSLQAVPDLWQSLGQLRKVGGMAMMGCGAPGQ
eukprot:TRINITY_DN255_c0_g7_i2.p1 TRINITY_DN255_c0_g7~~TRINITY_DN255_c0_g7_i2.p1  ORF type:complete len:883 (-),score=198.87 TRINITY_DN255_c0_g7_i2:115-2763(-)